MLESNIIRPSKSNWSSPIVLVKKKTGEYRFCVDYRNANELIKSDKFPLPRIDDLLSYLNNTSIFTTLDCFSGFFQIPVAKKYIQKTAFVCSEGLFEFLVTPFGLKTSANVFQRCMSLCLAGLIYNSCLVYVDDIVVMANGVKDLLQRMQKVFERFRRHNIRLKPGKCKFGYFEIEILGHTISKNGISPNKRNIIAIIRFPRPVDVSAVKSFVATASFYRKFIYNFATIAELLTRLTKRSVEFKWREEQEKSFNKVKETLVAYPVLAHFCDERCTELRVDASNVGLGAVLAQADENGEFKPCGYASRRLTDAESKYSTTEKELLGVVWGIIYFRPYLWGRKYTVVTDHHALCMLQK
jgi:hypothetical protein